MRLPGFASSLFSPGQRVCCALSGGADSTALLFALQDANRDKESLGVVLTAIHVHHGLRGAEADADEAFVHALCERLEIPLEVAHVDTVTRQAESREGTEEAARALRYAAFRELLTAGRADVVATAHTLDDQAETVLMKLLRGAWTEGLAGIAPVLRASDTAGVRSPPGRSAPQPGAFVRPLLATRRSEVELFLRERQQPWRTDSTNADPSFTRNRVRRDLLPLLRTFNPAVEESLARTSTLARDEEAFWQGEVQRLLPSMTLPGKPVRGGGRAVSTGMGEQSLAIELERLKVHPVALCRRLLRAAAATLGARLSGEETEKLMALAGLRTLPGLSARNGTRLDLGGGLLAERSLRELRLSRAALHITKKV